MLTHDGLSPEAMARFATPTWVDGVASTPLAECAVMIAEDPSVLTALIGALRCERSRLAQMTAARDEACRILGHTIDELAAHEDDSSMLDAHRNSLAELVAVGKSASR